jgi:ABC-type Fe3+ transport system permease subunit
VFGGRMSIVTIIIIGCIVGICLTLLGLYALNKVAKKHNQNINNEETTTTKFDLKFLLYIISGLLCWGWLLLFGIVLIMTFIYSSDPQKANRFAIDLFTSGGLIVTLFTIIFPSIGIILIRLKKQRNIVE